MNAHFSFCDDEKLVCARVAFAANQRIWRERSRFHSFYYGLHVRGIPLREQGCVFQHPPRLESRFERWRPAPKGGWREEGPAEDLPGLLYDLGAHLIDQAVHLLGPVDRVFASVRRVRPGVMTDDDTQVILEHVSGAVSILSVSSASAFTGPRLRLLGTGGGLWIDSLDTQEDALRAGHRPGDPDWGLEADDARVITGTDAPRSLERARGDWPSYYRGVVASVNGDGPAPVDARDVVANLRIIEAAHESGRLGVAVTLDPPAGHVSR